MLTSCLLLWISLFGPLTSWCAEGDVDALREQVLKLKDDADPQLLVQLAELQTRPAMEALCAIYDNVNSAFMRREVIRALARFDGVDAAQQPALELIANVATSSQRRVLREEALELLAGCKTLGKHFLAQIVVSDAQEEIREQALKLHIAQKTDEDYDWYKKLIKQEQVREASKGKRKKDSAEDAAGSTLRTVRELAFGAVAEALSDKEVSQHFEDSHNPAIRRRALVELHQRKAKGVEGLALDTLGRVGATGVDRAQAAEIYVQLKGTRAADKLIELALKKAPTPELLRVTIAELLGGLDDPSVNKKLKSLVGRGKPHEKIFALYATRHLDDADLLKKIRKGLNDRDAELRITTAQMLGERQDTEAVAQLEKMLGKAKSSDEKAVAIHALSHLYQGDQKWLEQLKSHVQKGDRQVRNAALQDLGQLKNPELLDFFVEYLFHEDWATRRISLHSLEGLRDARALGPIIERMARETGRMLVDFANTLWNLTGLPYDNEQPTWQKWWDNEGASFQVIDPSKLTQKEEEREERQLRRSTDVQFFGIRIVSHRVIFIIDVSGSMVQPLQTEMIDGRKATRMDVVKREIKESIEELEPAAFFNIVTFNSAVTLWLKEGIATSTKRSREEALQYIDRLGSRGGTNIFESLEVAFTDADVDTIFLLSDGEPTAGRIVDPHLIRQQVQRWNADRGIQIHTIAVGGALRVLEWIAQDSGGTYVKYN